MKAFFRVSRIAVVILALTLACPKICVEGAALAGIPSGGATVTVVTYYAPGSDSYRINFNDVTAYTSTLLDDNTIIIANLEGDADGLSFRLEFPLPDYSLENYNLPITYSMNDVHNDNISLVCNWLLRVDEDNFNAMLRANTKTDNFTVTITSIKNFPQGMSSGNTYITGTFTLCFEIENDILITVLGSFNTVFGHCRGSWLTERDYVDSLDDLYDHDYRDD